MTGAPRNLADHGSGFLAPGMGAVQRHIKDKLADAVSVKDYGARGDGRSDDTAAIQAALDAHGSVFLPSGHYRISRTLELKRSYGGLIGDATMPSITKVNPAQGPAIRISAPKGGTTEWVRVENLALWHGDSKPPAYDEQPSANTCCIAIDGSSSGRPAAVQRTVVRNVRVLGWGCGVYMTRHVNTLLERIYVEHYHDWSSAPALAGRHRYLGFVFDGRSSAPMPVASISPQASTEVVNCVFNGMGAPNGVTATGFHVYGNDPRDVFFDRCETAGGHHGWLVEASAADCNWNIHIRRPIVDAFTASGILLRNLAGPGAITVDGGYALGHPTSTHCLHAIGCSGVAITGGFQALGVVNGKPDEEGIRLDNCRNSIISGNTLVNLRHAITLSGCRGCSVVANGIDAQPSGLEPQPVLAFGIRLIDGTTASVVAGNTVMGGSASQAVGTGVQVEAGCLANVVVGNSLDARSLAIPFAIDDPSTVVDLGAAGGARTLSAPALALISTQGQQVYQGASATYPHRFNGGDGRQLVALNNAGAWVSNSDRRLKRDIVALPYGLPQIQALHPKRYRLRSEADRAAGTGGEAPLRLGLLAQEVHGLMPELVAPVGDSGTLGLDTGGLIPVLVNAVKELAARVQALEGGEPPAQASRATSSRS